jgi:hypothetical protein
MGSRIEALKRPPLRDRAGRGERLIVIDGHMATERFVVTVIAEVFEKEWHVYCCFLASASQAPERQRSFTRKEIDYA